MELSQRRIVVPSCASIVAGVTSRSFDSSLRSASLVHVNCFYSNSRRSLTWPHLKQQLQSLLSCTSANSAVIVCTTRHFPFQCRLGHLDGAHRLAQAPGRPCDRHAKESRCRPRREDSKPASKQHKGGRCRR
jgi:cytosine/adenosine deaminase-related metal-dependent hydrolase